MDMSQLPERGLSLRSHKKRRPWYPSPPELFISKCGLWGFGGETKIRKYCQRKYADPMEDPVDMGSDRLGRLCSRKTDRMSPVLQLSNQRR